MLDVATCVRVINHTNDTILVYFARHNDIESVEYDVSIGWFFELKFDETGKIIFDKNYGVIASNSKGRYCRPIHRRQLFRNNNGYFFIIKVETARNYTWDEIRKNRLYDTLIVTNEMLRKNDWRIDYYGLVE